MLFVVLLPIATFVKAIYNSFITESRQPAIRGKNILYVIAHPDDEAMFFVPSIRRLREHNKLYLLCLGNGDGAGLGRIREKELIQSAKYLGF